MTDFAAEFQAVAQFYKQLQEELSNALKLKDPEDTAPLAGSILQNRDRLAKIEKMHSRVLELSEEWKRCRAALDSKSRAEIDGYAAAARAHAVQLQQFCGSQTQKLQSAREKLGKRLAELGKGARYLQSVKPVKNNYPKFIDTTY